MIFEWERGRIDRVENIVRVIEDGNEKKEFWKSWK